MQGIIDRRRVARSFARAAADYDSVAALQREAAARLDAHLNFTRITPRRMLDIGCGTGFLGRLLRRRFPKAELVALDLVPEMINRCRRSLGRGMPWRPKRRFLCGDATALPLAGESFDLVASNLTMQWIDRPERMVREMRRVLAPGGLLLFSTFGGETLTELRAAFTAVTPGRPAPLLSFPDVMALGDLLQRQAVETVVTDSDRITRTYPDVTALVRELKAMGASSSAIRHRGGGLGGRGLLRRLSASYPTEEEGGIRATFEILYGQAWYRPDPKREGVIPIMPLEG
ncbi:MAG: malonyl-[acyl-carrier protein] O-methyltransferase BioC [Zetaproteobacteria bacterium]|nr:MAG: malonyl-[acyl-carrier protein] O-methyltransferase BioC [Zetaproteobacteria bacterium]